MNLLNKKRIGIYLAISFGFSWLVAVAIYVTGGIADSQPIVLDSPVTWVVPLLTIYMLGPLLGNLGARLLTGEGSADLWLRPNIRSNVRYWLLPLLLTPLFVLAGAALYFAVFPADLLPGALTDAVLPGLPTSGLPNWLLLPLLVLGGAAVGAIANALPTFGEEFGWRAYLQPKLLPLGERKMYLLTGLIWGIWHWPVIWMGYNYPGAPVLGSLAMVWFTISFGTFIGWATLRAGSVWPAVLGHGVLNATANFSLLLLASQPQVLLGPAPLGLLGGLFFTLTALLILRSAQQASPLSAPQPQQG